MKDTRKHGQERVVLYRTITMSNQLTTPFHLPLLWYYYHSPFVAPSRNPFGGFILLRILFCVFSFYIYMSKSCKIYPPHCKPIPPLGLLCIYWSILGFKIHAKNVYNAPWGHMTTPILNDTSYK